MEGTETEATIEPLVGLPGLHFSVLVGITNRSNRRSDGIVQPVAVERVRELSQPVISESTWGGDRPLRGLITDLATIGSSSREPAALLNPAADRTSVLRAEGIFIRSRY